MVDGVQERLQQTLEAIEQASAGDIAPAVELSVRLAKNILESLGVAGIEWREEDLAAMAPPVDAIRRFVLATIDTEGPVEPFREPMRAAAVDLDEAVEQVLETIGESVRTGLRPEVNMEGVTNEVLRKVALYEERLEARRLARELREDREESRRLLADQRRASGHSGEVGLANHFEKYARAQHETADGLRKATIALVIGLTVVLLVLLLLTGHEDDGVAEIAAKLSFVLPLAGLAAYLGREGSRHRESAQWASELEIQLLTVDAFTDPLPEAAREQVRLEFARRVFSARSSVMQENAPSVIADAAQLLEKLPPRSGGAEK